jgi:hypothetical protein
MRLVIPRLLLLLFGTAALAGCGVPGVPKPPSLDLPQPVSDLRAARKGDNVYLAWTMPAETTDHLAVRHPGPVRICRSVSKPMKECTDPVGEVPALPVSGTSSLKKKSEQPRARIQANYTDSLPPSLLVETPGAQIFYTISAFNGRGRSAGISNVISVPGVAVLAPPSGFAAKVTAEGVVLSWMAVPPPPEITGIQYEYRVYRRVDDTNGDAVAGEVLLDPSAPTQLVDHDFEWEKTYSYRATVVTLIRDEAKTEVPFEGDDTASIKVFAHDVFPPAVPSDLQAAFSGLGQQPFIDLIWAPDSEADLAGYNIFRHEVGGEPVKINLDVVKTPAFRDSAVVGGRNYFYSVSAIDVRGNESLRSQEASEPVP